MEENSLGNKLLRATKWSAISQVVGKLISPITNMILARIVSPEAFGVVAVVTMIMSFADMFTDAGFQKYLVQHEFKDESEKFKNANVAFWTNFAISILIWILIIIFRENIARSVGNPNLGNVIAIACIQLLMTSFSSIQMALYKRDFDFRTLFLVRLITICVPFILTIPLAYAGLTYWALIIGNIVMQLLSSIVLTIKSRWKPYLFYKVEILKEMFSFSMWSLIEAISIWFTAWADIFIIGNALSPYYLGIYRASTTMVNSLMGLIIASIVPVLFSALSRLQNCNEEFYKMYLRTQKLTSVFVFPLGIGIYLYSNLATRIMLGSQWTEASDVIGIWALTSAIMIVFGQLCSEVYRSKGRPKLSLLAQVLHLVVLVPVCIISARYGFLTLVYARSWIRMQFVVVHFFIMKFAMGFPLRRTIKNVAPTLISAVFMGIVGYFLQKISGKLFWDIISIALCIIFYFLVLFVFPSMRKIMNEMLKKYKLRNGN